MKTTKQRALDELVRIASSNRRIGDLPLLGLVEVVNALDAACLLAGPRDASYADACAASAVLSDEGFDGPTLESQVRKLVVAWSDARGQAGNDYAARTAHAVATHGPGSREALAWTVRCLPWVKFCEWRVDRDGVQRMMVAGTSDENGLSDEQRADLCAALDTQRAAGAVVLMEIDGLAFAHPDDSEPIDPDAPIPYTVVTPLPEAPAEPPFIGVPCVVCKQPRDRNDECTNPSCSVYVLPF